MEESDRERVRQMWRDAACAPEAFREDECVVAGADDHRCSPTGWVGVVELGGSTVVAAPSRLAPELAKRLDDRSMNYGLAHAARAADALGPAEAALGPAVLFYGSLTGPPTSTGGAVVGPLEFSDPLVRQVVSECTEEEVAESDLEGTTSGLFVALDEADDPGAACGWSEWPEEIAHLGVLTAAAKRRQGLGQAAAAAAINAAVRAGLLPQWRAAETNVGSRAIAERLGLTAYGRQYSYAPVP